MAQAKKQQHDHTATADMCPHYEAAMEHFQKAKDEPKVARDVGCKKFFPTIGMTLTVSCE